MGKTPVVVVIAVVVAVVVVGCCCWLLLLVVVIVVVSDACLDVYVQNDMAMQRQSLRLIGGRSPGSQDSWRPRHLPSRVKHGRIFSCKTETRPHACPTQGLMKECPNFKCKKQTRQIHAFEASTVHTAPFCKTQVHVQLLKPCFQ